MEDYKNGFKRSKPEEKPMFPESIPGTSTNQSPAVSNRKFKVAIEIL